ncbi:alcohol dehydrogenase [Nocardiopsis gilva YIM 90087]|uniref:Alcohol dehydrogenase n=1 Tax=Nocardiopsis gilva YIM 90087 TaxID=1235441 RepID=A0A223S4F0_9ACTN|nr:alcohol dehydrogenase catalytic domain-containing protein [Nocardiopsis gilva]ASU82971.1 alcohol dehydrogenase [Nocardiopsis gilva YIM 90087]
MKMRAAVLAEFGAPMEVREVEIAEPGPGEIRVRIAASGICASDLKAVDGTSPVVSELPVICGHESSGTVEAVGAGVTAYAPGDPVLIALGRSCGRCRRCGRGEGHLCTDAARMRAVMGLMPDGSTRLRADRAAIRPYLGIGGFAEYAVVHERQLVPLPSEVDLVAMSLLGCAVVTGVGAVVNTARVEAGATVLVVGCGGVGLNVVQGAVLAGASRVIASDITAPKLTAAELFGATDALPSAPGDTDAADLAARVRELVPDGVDYAFDVTGVPAVLRAAFEATRPGGTTVMVGSPPAGTDVAVPAGALFASRRLMGCQGGDGSPASDLRRLVDLCLAERLDPGGLISEQVGLDDINDAIGNVRAGEVVRSVVVF